jgi:hypothetical protein
MKRFTRHFTESCCAAAAVAGVSEFQERFRTPARDLQRRDLVEPELRNLVLILEYKASRSSASRDLSENSLGRFVLGHDFSEVFNRHAKPRWIDKKGSDP